MAFIETSALDATGVDMAFQTLLQAIYVTHLGKQLKKKASSILSTSASESEFSVGPTMRDSYCNRGQGQLCGKAINLMHNLNTRIEEEKTKHRCCK